jgi:hypothetical protein
MKIAASIFHLGALLMVSLFMCSCAAQQQAMQPDQDVPIEYQEGVAPAPCMDMLPVMDVCVEHGTMKKSCEEAELMIFTRVYAQTSDETLARKAGNACFLSCQSGSLMLGDFETAWREKFGGCR